MPFRRKELITIIEHEVERLQTLFDYKEFLILQLAIEQLSDDLKKHKRNHKKH